MLLFAVAAGLVVAACEETGWTGFAIPRFRVWHDVFGTGLIVGVLWGIWHMPSQLWAAGDASGALNLTLFMAETVFAMVVLPAYRLLMVWVYEHTDSLLVAMLMHAVLVASLFAILPADTSDVALLTCYVLIALAMWLVAAAVGIVSHGRLTDESPRTRMARGLPN